MDCPESCACKWKGGKQTVECVNASLSSIPNMDEDTQEQNKSTGNTVVFV